MSDMRGFIVELARAGGAIAREHFRHVGGRDVRAKGRGDYVSHADKLVEDAIVRRIRARFPSHRILGEESGRHDGDDAGNGSADDDAGVSGSPAAARATLRGEPPLWVIDPIDGTTNFIHGIPWFAVSIAYCIDGEPIDAVVYDPVRDECFIGERSAGFWVDQERCAVSGCTSLDQALIAMALSFRFPETHDDVARVVDTVQRRCGDQRRGGSAALDLAYVAAGRLDAYYELGIYPWDSCAGELLVRAAGGTATDLRGIATGATQRRGILAAASAPLHQELLPLMAPLAAWLDRAPFAAE